MAITNFISTVWSENLYKQLDTKYVAVANCNREWEGEIKQKGRICFWPLMSFVNDRERTAIANEWNGKNAQIEVVENVDTEEIKLLFKVKAANMGKRIQREIWDWGEDSEAVKRSRTIMDHYNNVAARL